MATTGGKKLIAGLGNPGDEYENTYHNAGWLALAELAPNDKKTKAHKGLFEYVEADDGTIFIKPLTYMNESGRAVREALRKFNIKPANLAVIHDDSDLTIGTYKISFARNSAGHKGVQSIIDLIATKNFTRIRIGIRPVREVRRQKAGEFALKNITPANKKILASVFSAIKNEIHVRART